MIWTHIQCESVQCWQQQQSCHQPRKQYKTNSKEQVGMNPGHDSPCYAHMAEEDITSHHERTCLFPLVQGIINPCALHPQPEIQCASELFSQITVTGRPVNVITYRGWDHASASHHTISFLAWAWECWAETLSNSRKATEGGFHAGQVTNQTASLGKLKGRLTLMEKQRGEVSMLSGSLQKMEDA